jgi:cytochrome c oxidase subunit 2|tara:strand:- start:9501 stop:10091 length:591 start_codon:yes stop_codon:yes gene_type:complete
MENALGLNGYQALMMTIVFGLGILGLSGLFLALLWPKRWRLKYRMEVAFVVVLIGLVWYADRRSTDIFTEYQDAIRQSGTVSAEGSALDGAFDREIKVIAFQWGFAFLTKEDEISRNAAIVKPGEKVLFRIFSNDVIHGFNIPAVGITTEFEPGEERAVWIRAPQTPGKYLIQCLNYCGVGHAQMKAWLVVQGVDA